MLLFPHDTRFGTNVMRRNVPITTPRATKNGAEKAGRRKRAEKSGNGENRNGQARPGRLTVDFTLAPAGGYFAAVGSGAGLSDSELR